MEPYAIIDGIRMTKADIAERLKEDPRINPIVWNYLYLKWSTLDKRSARHVKHNHHHR